MPGTVLGTHRWVRNRGPALSGFLSAREANVEQAPTYAMEVGRTGCSRTGQGGTSSGNEPTFPEALGCCWVWESRGLDRSRRCLGARVGREGEQEMEEEEAGGPGEEATWDKGREQGALGPGKEGSGAGAELRGVCTGLRML